MARTIRDRRRILGKEPSDECANCVWAARCPSSLIGAILYTCDDGPNGSLCSISLCHRCGRHQGRRGYCRPGDGQLIDDVVASVVPAECQIFGGYDASDDIIDEL